MRDPLALEHYELTAAQWVVANRLVQSTSLGQLVKTLNKEFAPAQFSPTEVWQIVGDLHRWGIVVATGTDQATALTERRKERRTAQWRWGWLQLLAWRLPGIQPQRLVDAAYGVLRPMMGRMGLACAVMLILVAASLVVIRFDEFISRLPTLAALWSPELLVATVATICGVKALHELGHALAARHHGVDVQEMGILLLCGVPTLYCDVSDGWRLPRRHQRLAITSAGIGVELLLASLACLVWWVAQPGIVQTTALCVMTFATAGTLLVNANPLLRYDGYYLLSDLTGTTNLWQRSREALRQSTTGWLWRRGVHEPPRQREPTWIALYGAVSQVYIVLLLATIGLTAWRFAVPRDLDVLAYGVIGLFAAAMIAPPLRRGVLAARNPATRQRFRWFRATVGASLIVALFTAVLAWPIRHRVECPARVAHQGSRDVVATHPGRLAWTIEPGERVREGDAVARLVNADAARELQTALAEQQLARLKVEQLNELRPHDDQAIQELPAAEANLAAADQRRGQLERELQRLVVRAPIAGIVLRAPPRNDSSGDLTLASWTGTATDEANRGAWIEAGHVLASVAPSRSIELRLGVAERDVARVREDQVVRVQLDALPGRVISGRVTAIAELGAESDTADSPWQTRLLDTLGQQRRYEATVELDQAIDVIPAGSRGTAKITVGQTTIGGSLLHWMRGLAFVD